MLYSNITTESFNNQPLRLLKLYADRKLTELLKTLDKQGLSQKEQLKVLRGLKDFCSEVDR